MSRSAVGSWFAVLLTASIALVPRAAAQGTARSMDIGVSIRSAAMGGASNAVWWGEEQDHWANPALLSETRGLRYEHGRTQLVPGLATDVFFQSDVVKLGAAGAGLVFSGRPDWLGGVRLDYGVSDATDPFGNPIGTYSSFETVDSWGFGVSPLRVVEAFRDSDAPAFSRIFDVSLGMNFKHVVVQLSPSALGAGAEGDCRDIGVLARFTPTELLRREPGAPPLPLRVDLSYGGSILNANDELFQFVSEDQSAPATRHRRNGGALHIAFDPLPAAGADAARTAADELLDGLRPLVSLGGSLENDALGAGDQVDYHTSGWGMEVAVARVFSLRRGHYTDRLGQIDGDTKGWSAGVPIGRFGGFLYQEATFPQATDSGLPDVERRSWLAWVDWLAISRLAGWASR